MDARLTEFFKIDRILTSTSKSGIKDNNNNNQSNQNNQNEKSKIVKKLELDPKKDEKKIELKTKKQPKFKKEKIKETKETFHTPKKKTTKVKLEKEQIKITKPTITEQKSILTKKIIKKKQNVIEDDDEDIEAPKTSKIEVREESKKSIKKDIKNDKLTKDNKNTLSNNNKNLNKKSPKKEKVLIPVSPEDFFNNNITYESKKQEIDKQKINEEINPIKEEIMEIEEDSDNFINDVLKNDNNTFFNNINNSYVPDKKPQILNVNIPKNFNTINKPRVEIKRTIKKKQTFSDIDSKSSKSNSNLSKTFKSKNLKNNIINQTQSKNYKTNNLSKQLVVNEQNNSNLWTDKYSPKSIQDIIGNENIIRKLELWLDNWDDCILKGKNNKPAKGGKFMENTNARAVIISGPPGIGKTSTVRVIANSKGYKTFELNASDKRNKDTINNSVGFLMNNTTISTDKRTYTKNLIIMDEVDGMCGSEDKGGIKALIDIVKKTKTPIIFICNDIYSNKLKSLINYCYSLKFQKPDKRQIALRLRDICLNENINIDNQSLDYIVESFNSDIRQTINFLEISSKFNNCNNNINNNYNIDDLKKECEKVKKDKTVSVNTFEVCKILLMKADSAKLTFEQKLDLFFIDFDLIPLMIYENYTQCANINNNSQDNINKLSMISDGLDNMSLGDAIDTKMKSKMDWSLLPNKGMHSTVIPSLIFSSYINYPKFPEIINKISSTLKVNRQLKELKVIFPELKLIEIKNLASPLLYNIIVTILIRKGKSGIDKLIEIFLKYKLNMNLFKDNLFELQTKNFQELYKNTNKNDKASFTKKLNERLKNSIKEKKSKTKTIMLKIKKRDKEGNIADESESEDDSLQESSIEEESSSLFEPIRKKNK